MNAARRCGGAAALMFPLLVAATEPAKHVLFMGTDLAVERNKSFYRVLDVSGSAFMVRIGEDPVFVPMQMRAANVKIEKSLKVTAATVKVDKLRGDRTFTPANDPRLKFDRATGAAAGAQAAAELARYLAVDLRTGIAGTNANPAGGGARAEELERMLQKVEDMERMAEGQSASDFVNIGAHAHEMQGALRDGNFDAMEVEFEVSSEVPINDAYLVIISRFREKTDKPGYSRNWIYAKSIGEIGPKPRYLRVREGGFPLGFILEDYEVHIYDRGRELASNVSPKRVELTTEEAHQYLIIEHLAAYKGQTAAAEPVIAQLPADLGEKMASGQYLQNYFVKVDEAGLPAGAFIDGACSQPISDPYLEAIFASMRFKPALVDGKPVAAICRVKLPGLRL